MPTTRSSVWTTLLAVFMLSSYSAWGDDLSRISGHIVGEDHAPIPNAQVFLEQGLLFPVERVVSNEEGYFEFTQVLPGTVGIIAHSPGLAFNGFSLILGTGDIRDDNTIVLSAAGQLTGKVINSRKKPVAKAYITHALLQNAKVVIPFRKLRNFGIAIPISDEKGHFIVNELPLTESVALKISHAKYAQGMAAGLSVGEANEAIVLSEGVLVSGTIRTSDTNSVVPNAAIIFRNNHPPRDTAIARSREDGVYLFRLNPGDYTYESVSSRHTSTIKEQIIITGHQSTEEINLTVAPKVMIKGKVLDAVTSQGIAGARIRLETNGKLNAIATTGAQGLYSFSAPAGEVTLRFLQAPGYLPPPIPSFAMPLTAGKVPPTPTFWLTKLPTYSLAVVDAQQQPVDQAVVHVLNPLQLGWRRTNAQGMVDISLGSMPKGGRVIGYVEHSTGSAGAAFSIEAKDAQDAIVQLIPQHTIKGRVVNTMGEGLAGWTVSCQITQDASTTPVTLWNTVTDSTGEFHHPGVMEGVPLLYSASHEHEGSLHLSAPAVFTLEVDSTDILPDLIVQEGESGKTLIAKKFPWRTLSGDGLDEISNWKGERIVLFVPSRRVASVLESFEHQQEILESFNKRLVIVFNASTAKIESTIPLFTGSAPASAKVYIVSEDNRVVAESNRLPTLSHIRNP